jgi:glycosyltransferase involved in cell wall biosynthesis
MTVELERVETAIVLARLELGGAARQSLLLAEHLRDACGARVRVIALGPEEEGFATPGRVADWCDARGIPWERLREERLPSSPAGKLSLIAALARSLRRNRIGLVLPYTSPSNFTAALAWFAGGARACVWSQRTIDEGYHPGPAQQRAARHCAAFISNTAAGATFLVTRLGAPRELVHHVPNAVTMPEPKHSAAEWRERLGIAPGAFLAVSHAQMHGLKPDPHRTAKGHVLRKDPETLVRAWRRLASEGFEGTLVLAGGIDPPRAARLRELAGESRVVLTGEIDDVAGLLAAADLGLFSSHEEGMPNAALECMYAGLAIVSVDLPGTREVLGPAQHADLLRPGDDDGFARTIRELAASPERRRRLAEANRARAWTEFSRTRMLERTTKILTSVLGDSPSKGGP